MPDQSAIVQELYSRIGSLPADKQAIVSELARRYGIGPSDALTGGAGVPDAAARAHAGDMSRAQNLLDAGDAVQMPTNPYGGAPVVTVHPDQVGGPVGSLVSAPLRGAGQMIDGSARIANAHTARDVAGGAHQIIGGGMGVLTPTIAAAGIAAPVATAIGLGSGMLASNATSSGLHALGVPDEYSDLAGDAAGIVGGGAVAHYGPAAVGRGMRRVGDIATKRALASTIETHLDPAEASAVAYGDQAGVNMPVSVRTGSPVAAYAEKVLSHIPLASGVAKAARLGSEADLQRAAAGEVAGLGSPDAGAPPTALDAGEGIHAKLDAKLAGHQAAGEKLIGSLGNTPGAPARTPLDVGEGINKTAVETEAAAAKQANDSYSILRTIENQPQFKARLQTGTRMVEGVDEAGNPTQTRVPVFEDLQLPVSYRGLKEAVKPLLAEALRPMSIAQEQSSTGIKAMRNILDAPDYVSASTADQDLGALKKIIRESPQSPSVAQAAFAAKLLSKQIDGAVARAGPDAVAALQQGRDATVAKYKAQQFQSDLGFSDVGSNLARPGEPVGLFNRLTLPGDRSVNLLRSVQQNAPAHLPAIGQAVADGLMDHVRDGAPQNAVSGFAKLGDVTKSLIYPEPKPALGANGAPLAAAGPVRPNGKAVGGYFAKAFDLQNAKNALPAADRLVSALTTPGDKNVNVLRAVASQAPEHLPAIGQAVLQHLIDTSQQEAGMGKPVTALRQLSNMGPLTKKILFSDPYPNLGEGTGALERATDLLTLMKRMSENPNPSGSGTVIAFVKSLGLVITQPHLGVPMLIGARGLARMLFNPKQSSLMMAALKLPAGAPGSALLAKQVLTAAGQDAVAVSPQNAGPIAPAVPPVAQSESEASGATNAGATATPGAQPSNAPASAGAGAGNPGGLVRSADTRVGIPGESGPGYAATYKLRELADVQPSHSGLNFLPNPKYGIKNDRNYSNAVNQGKIINWSTRSGFKPSQVLSDIDDATGGPPVVDADGNVLGGNGRTMIMQRVHASNPKGAAAYRDLLAQKAAQFGIDPAELSNFKEPVLVREIPDSEFTGGARTKQNAVTDFNKTGTADLTPPERAIADSRRVSPETLDHLATRLDALGDEGTLAKALEGKHGNEVIDNLVRDGVLTDHQRAAYQTEDGLTKEGKARISSLMTARFFSDPAQLEAVAPSIRNKIERIAAPLAQIENRPDWNISHDVESAVSILDQARRLRIKSIDDFLKQDGIFGADKYSPHAVQLARQLQEMKPTALASAFRQYAQDSNFAAKGDSSLFGAAPTPDSAFEDAFGAAPKNALAPRDVSAEQNALDRRRNGGQKGALTISNPFARFAPADESGGGGGSKAVALKVQREQYKSFENGYASDAEADVLRKGDLAAQISLLSDGFKLNEFRDKPRLPWVAFDEHGNESGRGAGYGVTPSDTWAAFANDIAREAAKMAAFFRLDETDPVYIRYGKLPKGGLSTNWATGQKEKGTSVFHAKRNFDGSFEISGSAQSDAHIKAVMGAYGDDAYLVQGEKVGRGSDGEPLLRNVQIADRLKLDPEAFVYRGGKKKKNALSK